MEQAAEALEFERAAALRDRIRAISVLGKTQQVIAGVCADTDVWGVYPGAVRCGWSVLHIEDGNLLGREVDVFPAQSEEDEASILAAVLSQYYLGRGTVPVEILLPVLPEEGEALGTLLTEQAGHKVTLRVPQRGERAELLRLCAAQRARGGRAHHLRRRAHESYARAARRARGINHAPHRIESYDISNTGASDMVASMVVFCDGRPSSATTGASRSRRSTTPTTTAPCRRC